MKSQVLIDRLLEAVYRADEGLLASLLDRETVNLTDDDGRTPLMHAVLAESPSLPVVRRLIDSGAEVDVADEGQCWTALHFAARDKRADVVNELLLSGASPDIRDAFGNTPLWRATFHSPPDKATILALLEAGADPHSENESGVSPIDLADRKGDAELLAILMGSSRPDSA